MKTRFTLIVLILMKITSIRTQHPTCSKFDFSDPLTINEFRPFPDAYCGSNVSRMVMRSYNDSSITPLHSSSRYFLSVIGSSFPFCLSRAASTEATPTSVIKMAYFLQGTIHNASFFEVMAVDNRFFNRIADIILVNNRWTVYEGRFRISGRLRLSGVIDSRNTLAIEYLHIYNPQVSDENCVPTVTSTTTTTTTTTTTPKLCHWEPGQEIAIGTRCVGQHGFFVFQLDGNAVIYDLNNVPLWNTATSGIGHTFLFETNGNLAMYSSTGSQVWNSASSNMGASLLVFQEDRNLVIYNTANTPAVALWNSRTFVP